jgi:hypothetical protein
MVWVVELGRNTYVHTYLVLPDEAKELVDNCFALLCVCMYVCVCCVCVCARARVCVCIAYINTYHKHTQMCVHIYDICMYICMYV